MVKQEINEFLAERLFGLIEKRKGSNCYYDIKRDEPKCCGCPDYIANYQPVLERLKGNQVIEIALIDGGYKYRVSIKQKDIYGKTNIYKSDILEDLGEAFCRAAVELLKAREGK